MTTKGGVTMKGKYLSPKAGQPIEVPSRFLDENHSWRMLTRREKAMLTEGQLYAYEKFWDTVVTERECFLRTAMTEELQKARLLALRRVKPLVLRRAKPSG